MPFRLNNLRIPYIHSKDSNIWGCNLLFEDEKFYHIKANSGKGKTSFIHTLFGIQKNFDGELLFEGKSIKSYSHDAWCEVRSNKLGIVFQDLRLFEQQTAMQNLLVKNELTNFSSEAQIHQFAERLHISHTLHRKIHTLSYGERQRVAIIRALLQPMRCLLLDEPFSHLDNSNITLASALILEEVQKRKATLILCDLETDHHFPYHYFLQL